MNKRLFYLHIIWLFSIPLFAQKTNLKVKIVDSLGMTPIPYTLISLKIEGKDFNLVTDEKGMTDFKDIPLSIANFSIRQMGYKKLTSTVNLSEVRDYSKPLIFVLQKGDANLTEFVVSSNRLEKKSDRYIYHFNKEEVESSTHLTQLLAFTPLINVTDEGGILIKGNPVGLLYIDGKPVLNPRILKSLPAEGISKIEVLTNPGSQYEIKNGGKGVINIITKSGILGDYGEGSLSFGTRLSDNANIFYSAKGVKFDYNLTAGISTYDKPFTTNESRIAQNILFYQDNLTNSRSYQPYFDFGAVYRLDSIRQISFSNHEYIPLFRNANTFSYFQPVSLNAVPILDFVQYNTINKNEFSYRNYLDYQYRTKRTRWTLSFLADNASENDDYQLFKNFGVYTGQHQKNDETEQEYTIQLELGKTISSKYKFTTGLKALLRDNNSSYSTYFFNSSGIESPDTTATSIGAYKYRQYVYSLYYNNNIQLSKKANIVFGIRGDYSKDETAGINLPGRFYLLPNITFSYEFDNSKNLTIDYRKGVKRPDITYLNPFVNISDFRNLTTGNGLLKYESSNNAELSYTQTIKNHFFSITADYNQVDNAIETFYEFKNNNSILIRQINLENKTQIGGSIFYRFRVPKKLNASLSIGEHYVDLSYQGVSNNQWLFSINSNMSYTISKGLYARLFYSYNTAPIFLQGTDSDRSSIDFSITKKISERWSIGANARNFFAANSHFNKTIVAASFYQQNKGNYNINIYSLSVAFNFGKQKYSNKNRLQINNDDRKSLF